MIDSDIPDAEIIRLICSHMTDTAEEKWAIAYYE